MHFEIVSDNEMVILTSSDKTAPTELTEAVCVVYANGKKVELPFSIKEGHTKEVDVFVPENPNAIPGVSAGEAVVTETALGIYIRFPVSCADDKAIESIIIAGCDGMDDFRGGGFVCGDDGNWYAEMTYGQGTPGDTLTVSFCDYNEKPLGEIVFNRK